MLLAIFPVLCEKNYSIEGVLGTHTHLGHVVLIFTSFMSRSLLFNNISGIICMYLRFFVENFNEISVVYRVTGNTVCAF